MSGLRQDFAEAMNSFSASREQMLELVSRLTLPEDPPLELPQHLRADNIWVAKMSYEAKIETLRAALREAREAPAARVRIVERE